MRLRSLLLLYVAGAATLATATPAGADTLADAIAQAYRNNPGLQQQRALQRGLDETYVQAAAGLRPTVQLQVAGVYTQDRFGKAEIAANSAFGPSPTRQESNSVNAQLVLSQPLYTGGRVAAQIRSSEDRIAAGQQGLRVSEADLLLNVVDAYTSVRRDLQVLQVRQAALDALVKQLDEARARRAVGDATVTDVAQADAQLQQEQANYSQAQQQLQTSRNSYTVLVGAQPGALEPEPELPNQPLSVDQAFEQAEADSPDLQQAKLAEAASRAALVAARAARRPTVALQATYGYQGVATPLYAQNLDRDLTAQAVINVPLYSGGVNSSNIRAAIEQNNADRQAVEAIRRAVVQNIGNAWNAILIARRNVGAQERQVKAAAAAYEGMQVEYRDGQRSTFEVLYAEQTLRNAEVSLLAAHHDAYYAEAAVLRFTGSLEARFLASGVPLYDPRAHQRAVRRTYGVPWDPAVQGLDSLGMPGAGHPDAPVPALASAPVAIMANAAIAPESPLSTTLPTQPVSLLRRP